MAIANITGNILTDSGISTSSLLPLSGGTLTGALSGTSATFSGAIAGRSGGYLALYDISTNTNRWDIYTNSDNSFRMNYNGSGGDELIIASTGAATFSSSIAATSATFSGVITGQSNGNTFGTASATGRAVIIQAGSSNQAIMFKNAAGGDGTLFINGTSTSIDYNFNTYSVGDALVIKNNGNVGIGTSSPTYKLDVYGGASGTRTDVFVSNAAANYNIGVLSDNNGFASSTNAMLFYTAANERMRITSGGNVGIGTS